MGKEVAMTNASPTKNQTKRKQPITLLEIPQQRGPRRRAPRPKKAPRPARKTEPMHMLLTIDQYENLYQVDHLRNRSDQIAQETTESASGQWTNSIRLNRTKNPYFPQQKTARHSSHAILRQQILFTGFVSSVLAIQAFGIIWMMTH